MAVPLPRFEDYIDVRPAVERMTLAEIDVLMDKIWEHMPSRIVCKHPPLLPPSPPEDRFVSEGWRWRRTSSGGPR